MEPKTEKYVENKRRNNVLMNDQTSSIEEEELETLKVTRYLGETNVFALSHMLIEEQDFSLRFFFQR